MKHVFALVILAAVSSLRLTAQAQSTIPLLRYYNQQTDRTLYTSDPHELEGGKYGFVLVPGTDNAFLFGTQMNGTVPLHRYHNPQTGAYYYSIGLGLPGFRHESDVGFVYTSPVKGTVPLLAYRGRTNGDYVFTTNSRELANRGDVYEFLGTACYMYQEPYTVPQPDPLPDRRDVDRK